MNNNFDMKKYLGMSLVEQAQLSCVYDTLVNLRMVKHDLFHCEIALISEELESANTNIVKYLKLINNRMPDGTGYYSYLASKYSTAKIYRMDDLLRSIDNEKKALGF